MIQEMLNQRLFAPDNYRVIKNTNPNTDTEAIIVTRIVLRRLLLKALKKSVKALKNILSNFLLTIKNSVFIFYMVTYLIVTERQTKNTENFFLDSVFDILLVQKCTNIKVYEVEKNSYLDVIVLCNVNSNTQMVSSVKKLKELVKSKNKNFFSEGLDSSWALVEFEGVGIHFFTEEAREYYNLEDLFFDSNLVNQYG